MILEFVDYREIANLVKDTAKAIKKVAKDVNDQRQQVQNISETHLSSVQEINRIADDLKPPYFQ